LLNTNWMANDYDLGRKMDALWGQRRTNAADRVCNP